MVIPEVAALTFSSKVMLPPVKPLAVSTLVLPRVKSPVDSVIVMLPFSVEPTGGEGLAVMLALGLNVVLPTVVKAIVVAAVIAGLAAARLNSVVPLPLSVSVMDPVVALMLPLKVVAPVGFRVTELPEMLGLKVVAPEETKVRAPPVLKVLTVVAPVSESLALMSPVLELSDSF